VKGCSTYKLDTGRRYDCCINCHLEEDCFVDVEFNEEHYTVCCHVRMPE